MRHIFETPRTRGLAIAAGKIGIFHSGHSHLVESLAKIAKDRGLHPVLATFFPNPAYYFTGSENLRPIVSLKQKKRIISAIFPELSLMMLKFDLKLSEMDASEVCAFLRRSGVEVVVCGEDFRFGKNRCGDADLIKEFGMDVEVVPAKKSENDRIISTTLIRGLLTEGDFESVNPLLPEGGAYRVEGRVVRGAGLAGAKLGVKTANIVFPRGLFRFKYGVYACDVMLKGIVYSGVMNFGVKPTFSGDALMCEVHIFDFRGDLYGEMLEVFPLKFIREERRFASIEGLREQIMRDIEEAKFYFLQRRGVIIK